MRRDRDSKGQAALTLVLAMVLLLATSGSLLAANAFQHDPLVQSDVVEHYAYRALEAGMNSYLSTINADPALVNCNSTSTSSTCATEKYDTWNQVQVTGTTGVPEYYLWTNPQLCFSSTPTKATTCTSSASSGNLEYVQILVIGAAGMPGHFQYQQSVANFAPRNGFLTHLWWSNFEAEPNNKTATRNACKYDYANSYKGPGATCVKSGYAPGVYFGPGDVIDGPVFTNDSIYVATDPIFGTANGVHLAPIETADTGCLVVTNPSTGAQASTSKPTGCKSNPTQRAKYTKTNSHDRQAKETPPSTDTSLETLAALGGCLYTGPTTISFLATNGQTAGHKVGYMNVYSPETPTVTITGKTYDANNTRTKNHNTCLGTDIRVPDGTPTNKTGSKGNGVIFVKTNTATSSCTSEDDNPFDAYLTAKKEVKVKEKETEKKKEREKVWTTHAHKYVTKTVTVTVIVTVTVTQLETVTGVTTTRAQIVLTGSNTYNDTDTTGTVNCAGDAFVHDANSKSAPTGRQPGFAGNLTVAAQNNVIITGALHYTDCGAAFTGESSCTYHVGSGAVNDSLGLIANNYVVLNRPVCPSTSGSGSSSNSYCTSSRHLLKRCSTLDTASTWTTWEDALCSPGATVQIDGAVLALNHSFAVDNFTTGGTTGKLIVYGAMAQYWRGEVGVFGGQNDGYSKYYTWDSRLQYVSIPYYLTPGTTSWGLVSSTVDLGDSCPAWPQLYPKGYPYVKTKVSNATTILETATTHKSISRAPTPTGNTKGTLCT